MRAGAGVARNPKRAGCTPEPKSRSHPNPGDHPAAQSRQRPSERKGPGLERVRPVGRTVSTLALPRTREDVGQQIRSARQLVHGHFQME